MTPLERIERSVRAQAIMRAAFMVQDAREYAFVRRIDINPDHEGAALGSALGWAHALVDDGADPEFVRGLLKAGLQAGRGKP